MGAILSGIVIAVVAAAIIASWGGIRAETCKAVDAPFCDPVMPTAFVGNWDFIRFDPVPPPSPVPGFTVELRAIRIADDNDYSYWYTIGGDGGPEIEQQGSGTYQVESSDDNRVVVDFRSSENARLLGTNTMTVTGDVLRMTDQDAGITIVYARASN